MLILVGQIMSGPQSPDDVEALADFGALITVLTIAGLALLTLTGTGNDDDNGDDHAP